jgi:hypothetical protein
MTGLEQFLLIYNIGELDKDKGPNHPGRFLREDISKSLNIISNGNNGNRGNNGNQPNNRQ